MAEVVQVEKQLLIDPARCIGCRSCAGACYYGHLDTPALAYEEIEQSNAMPMVCRQCEDAPCVAACPRDAMYKDDAGIVRRSAVLCTGCLSCVLACPFGVLNREIVKRQVAKCDLCADRTRQSPPRMPRCVSVCPSGALKFMELEQEVVRAGYQLLSGRIVTPLR